LLTCWLTILMEVVGCQVGDQPRCLETLGGWIIQEWYKPEAMEPWWREGGRAHLRPVTVTPITKHPASAALLFPQKGWDRVSNHTSIPLTRPSIPSGNCQKLGGSEVDKLWSMGCLAVSINAGYWNTATPTHWHIVCDVIRQSWVSATDTVWPVKSKIFTTENICRPQG
jgi:hypothetical protein